MVLGLADDLDILGESLENAAKVTRPLGNEVKKQVFRLMSNKTKIMELLEIDKDPKDLE